MTPNQWQKAKELFEEGRKRPSDDWARFLDENDDGDQEVRSEVESLLANSEGAIGFLEQPAIREVAEAIVGNREPFRLGQNISHYKIIKLLGTGGMGQVYLADDTRLHRQVALKVLSDHLCGNQEGLQRFLREIHSASALNHPNICTIYGVDDYGDSPFIAMEYIPGETLDKKIKTRL